MSCPDCEITHSPNYCQRPLAVALIRDKDGRHCYLGLAEDGVLAHPFTHIGILEEMPHQKDLFDTVTKGTFNYWARLLHKSRVITRPGDYVILEIRDVS